MKGVEIFEAQVYKRGREICHLGIKRDFNKICLTILSRCALQLYHLIY